MNNQYIGDINDYKKYDLLLSLQEVLSQKILVVWMLTGADTDYISMPEKYAHYNPGLFRKLQEVVQIKDDKGSIKSIEELPFFSDRNKFDFYDERIDRISRIEYFNQVQQKANNSQIVFFDPDTGICDDGKEDKKHISWSEIKNIYKQGKDVLVFQFDKHELNFLSKLEEDCAANVGIRNDHLVYFNAGKAVYLLLLQDNTDKIGELKMRWSKWDKGPKGR
jgi:hypothetical protein